MCRSGSFWSFLQVLVAASVLLVGCGGGDNNTGGDPTLSRLEIEPAAPSLAKGSSLPLQVMAIRTDGGKTNVTNQVQWTSAKPSIATVSNTAPNIGRLTAVSVGSTTIVASLQGSTVSATVTVTPAVPVSVAISPASADLPNGTALNLVATATFSDSTTQDVTEDSDWSSSDAAVIAVSNADGTRGRATAGAASGSVDITASYAALSGTATLTATAALVTRVEVSPSELDLAKGTSGQLQATAVFSDGTNLDITAEAQWSSVTQSTATVGNDAQDKGRAKAIAVGETTIRATYLSTSGESVVTVTPAVIDRIEVSPAVASAPKGTERAFTATAIFSDMSTQDVTALVVWASSDSSIATVSNAEGTTGLAQAVSEGLVSIEAKYLGRSDSATLTVTAAVITAIEVAPDSASLPKGTSRAFTATAVYSDATVQDVTTVAVWSSTADDVASVSNADGSEGQVQALSEGEASISASYLGASDVSQVTVTPAVLIRVDVTPASTAAAKGTSRMFSATAIYSDTTTADVSGSVTWTSSDTSVASISNADGTRGLAKALTEGTTTISASFMTLTGSATFAVTPAELVTVEVTPATASIPLGAVQQYVATGIFTDGSTQQLTDSVTWSAADPDVIDISNADGNAGLAVASNVGETQIRAAVGDISGSTSATVTAAALIALQVTPTNARLAVDFQRQLRAFGRYSDSSVREVTAEVAWSTNDGSLATVSNAAGSRGLATGVSMGTVSVSAQLSGIIGSTLLNVTDAALTNLQVTPGSASLPLGNERQFVAIGTFSDSSVQILTEQVTWSSADPAIATITAAGPGAGLATGVAVGGPIDITASRDDISGVAALTVTDAVLVSISVSPPTKSIPKGLTQQFMATGTYSDDTSTDITDAVTWSSSDNATATISNADGSEGLATAEAVGTVTVQASADGIVGDAQLTVTDAVLVDLGVTPATATVALGVTQAFQATGTYSDSSTRDLTGDVAWTSDNESVATISNADDTAGQASTHAVGTITVTASTEGVSDTAQLEVTAAALQTIVIAPMDATLPAGTTQQLTATGNYSDGTTENLTTTVTWSTSDPAVAEVSNGEESRGVALGKTVGAITVTATDPVSGVVGTAPLTVTSALLQAIVITPANAMLPTGFGQQYTASGQFSDGVFRDVTTQVSWSTINPAVANIDNSTGRKGFVTAVSPGSTSVVANLNGVSATTAVSVANIALTSIDVTPKDQAFSAGESLQFTAIGTFADDSSLDLTRQVIWSSSNVNAARISNAEGSEGLATAGSTPATSAITATRGDINGSTTLRRRLF